MLRLDVYRLRNAGRALIIDVQAELLASLEICMVAPLIRVILVPLTIKGLNQVVTIEGADFVMLTQQMTALAMLELGRALLSLTAEHHAITRALDQLLVCF